MSKRCEDIIKRHEDILIKVIEDFEAYKKRVSLYRNPKKSKAYMNTKFAVEKTTKEPEV